MNDEILANLEREISTVVDNWVSTILKDRLMSGTSKPSPRSMWDRLKQGVANWWYGPQGEKDNPYRWQNRFGNSLGSAGVRESFDPSVFTLHEYSEIRQLVESVESRINESNVDFEKLKLTQILRAAAGELKVLLFNALKKTILSAPTQANAVAAPDSKAAGAKIGRYTRPKKTGGGPAIDQNKSKSKTDKRKPKQQAKVAKDVVDAARDGSGEETRSIASDPTVAVASPSETPREKAKPKDEMPEDSAAGANEQMMGYLQDEKKGKRYDIDDSLERLDKFIRSSEKLSKNQEIKKWWMEKAGAYIEMAQKESESRALESLWDDLIGTDNFVEAIAQKTSINKDMLKKMMVSYLKDNLERDE